MDITARNVAITLILYIATLGLYSIYWFAATKQEINKMGGTIPTVWLFIIPLAHIYFLYQFAQEFSRIILHDESQKISYFLLLLLLPPIGILVCQLQMNKVVRTQ